MSKKTILPSTARHVVLNDEDWEYLETRFGPQGIKPVGVSRVVRSIIHKQIREWREAENQAATKLKRESEKNAPTNL